ncbi:cytochrome C [Methylobacterium durans]|uniref:c-type cytochrome n=1 Tax=Methylobacterium durans TaxID=2202825 RepID=UPI002AFF303F|nr:cytochrome C [Methylobacterium durans]MEA1834296.1 cytochrome C [Methylobacterium durans]
MAGSIVASADRAAAAEDGASLVAICAACHRLDGHSTGIPSILRWEAEEIVDKMHAFREGGRASTVMRAVGLSLSDDEIAAVADELAAIGRRVKSP